MIRRLALASAALGLLAAPVAHAEEQAEMTKGEAKLAKMLEGRVAGKPESCITMIGTRPLTRIDETALVYKSGNTIWVNYTKTPDAIDDSDYMVIQKFSGSQLCRSDQITTRDRFSDMYTGFIFLDDFVPYRFADKEGEG